MTDVFPTAKRSEIMSRVKSEGTDPEKKIGSLIHRLGYRFRLHVKRLPGKPDLVLRRLAARHLCEWMFLASTPGMLEGQPSYHERGLLERQAGRDNQAGQIDADEAPSTRLASQRCLGA